METMLGNLEGNQSATTTLKTPDLSHQVWCGIRLMCIHSRSSVVGAVETGYLLMNPRSAADEGQTIVDKRITRHGRVDECW